MPHLNIVDRKGERTIELGAATITIGRASDNPVSLDDPKSSRKHTQITLVGADYFLVDLKSRNGTYLNGRKIEREPLRDGDIITIGDSKITFIGSAPSVKVEGDATIDSSEDFFADKEAKPIFTVVGIGGEVRGREIKLGDKTTIGRKSLNDIVLEDDKVSGMHAVIVRDGDKFTLRDLNSTNGTKIRGQRIRQAELDHGVVFRIGACEFKFLNPELPEVDSKTPKKVKPARREDAKYEKERKRRAAKAGLDDDFFAEDPDTGFLTQEEVSVIAARAKAMEGARILDFVYIALGIVLFCGVLFGAFTIFSGYKGTGVDIQNEGRPIDNRSFETSSVGKLPGWQIPSEGVSITTKRARSGRQSLQISSGSGEIVLATPLSIQDNSALIVRYFMAGLDAGLTGVKIRWRNPNYSGYEETVVGWLKRGTFGGSAWVEMEKLFVPPPCADEGVLVLWSGESSSGVGSAYFDDITVFDEPLGGADAVDSLTFPMQKNHLQLYATERGLVGMLYKRRPLFWSAGLGSVRRNEIEYGQDTAEITDSPERNEVGAIVLSGSAGLLLDGESFACAFRQTISTNGETCIIQYRLESSPPESGTGIAFLVSPSSLKEMRVTTTDVQDIEKVPIIIENVKEILFGTREDDLVSIETSAPVTLYVRETKDKKQRIVFCEFTRGREVKGMPGYRLSVGRIPLYRRIGHWKDLEEAEKALGVGNLEKAENIADNLLRKSRDPQIRKRAREIKELVAKKRDRLKTSIVAIVEDIKKYRRRKMKVMFDSIAAQIEKAFANTDFARSLAEMRAEVDKALSGVSATADNEAADLIRLAEMKRVKYPALALMYYEEVLMRFPDSPQARDAQHWSEKLRADIARRRR
ncbi:MAG: FHA domain-containing protein [Planctomycetota bacterium]|jgi:pSer/pThr/pTyr-binding forkhead associated (FHA) protein